MCKIKEYTKSMQQSLISVMLRFDTYLLEDEKEGVIKMLRNVFGGNITESFMSEYLQQVLDIDSIALLHNSTITDILKTHVLILDDVKISNYVCQIFVHKYFIAIYCKDGGIDIPILKNEIISQVQKQITDKSYDLPAEYLCIRLLHHLNELNNQELWGILDKSAFSVIDAVTFNGRYTDTSSRDSINIDLTRTISPSEKEGCSNIAIQTMACVSLKYLSQSIEYLDTMLDLSKEEISRCFNI